MSAEFAVSLTVRRASHPTGCAGAISERVEMPSGVGRTTQVDDFPPSGEPGRGRGRLSCGLACGGPVRRVSFDVIASGDAGASDTTDRGSAPSVRTRPPSRTATAVPSRKSIRFCCVAGILSSSGVMMPKRFNGSDAEMTTSAPVSGSRRIARSSPIASGSANCYPLIPATKRPPRISPRASSLRYTVTSSRHAGAPASRASSRRNTTP